MPSLDRQPIAYVISRDEFLLINDALDENGDFTVDDGEFARGIDAAWAVFTPPECQEKADGESPIFASILKPGIAHFRLWDDAFRKTGADSLRVNAMLFPLPEVTVENGGLTSVEFVNGTAPAEVSIAHYFADSVAIYSPAGVTRVTGYGSGFDDSEIAYLLAEIDPAVRPLVNDIRLEPENLGSALMSSSETGEVGLYALPVKSSRRYAEFGLYHEIGHVWSMGKWGGFSLVMPGWERWIEAAHADGKYIRKYSRQNFWDDFADTFALYFYLRNHKGLDGLAGDNTSVTRYFAAHPELTPLEAMKKAFPNRMVIIEEIAAELDADVLSGNDKWDRMPKLYAEAHEMERQVRYAEARGAYDAVLALDPDQAHAAFMKETLP